jgi:hypothetical protein
MVQPVLFLRGAEQRPDRLSFASLGVKSLSYNAGGGSQWMVMDRNI